MSENQSLTIAWLYPDLMSTYGDRGNVIVLQKRAEWRGIKTTVKRIYVDTKTSELEGADLIFMGGAQDTQQEIVNDDLFKNKGELLSEKINHNIPALFICGAYQFLGNYYKTADNKKLPGLKLFPLYTENPGYNVERLIGNIIIKVDSSQFVVHSNAKNKNVVNRKQITKNQIVGFENHGGRTYLEDNKMAFATVEKGFGNNGIDKTEGIMFKNAIGSYLHGPILPKNPSIADFLIQKALEEKYKKEIKLELLNDQIADEARNVIVNRA